MATIKIRPVILSGGSGTRLWPVSRVKAPKQFIPLTGEENLFTSTLKSCSDAELFLPPAIVGNEGHKFLIHDALEAAHITPAAVFLEPVGRNTAAAALVAALSETDPNALHLVRPSDHVIGDPQAWREALLQAVCAAKDDYIVLFGIKPDCPETGYGYILKGDALSFENVLRISSFKEKPDVKTATALIADGALWNSGIFLYSPRALVREAKRLAPDLVKQIQKALDKGIKDPRGYSLDAETYRDMPNEPFDRVIMENTSRGAVVPCSMEWNDVGSWQALWQSTDKDNDGNVTLGSVVSVDTRNSYVRSEGPAVAVLGMEDVAVVAMRDAVLVTPRSKTQSVKNLVAAVQQAIPDLTQNHAVMRRPWGSYEGLAKGKQFQVKHIVVLPGRSLSLQMHHHRAEHWIIVEGAAKVECGDIEKMLFPNESIYIPKGTTHRLTNPGIIDLHLIEVQSGDYLGEDDIVRYADNYGRAEQG
ncbi:MAG: mannose-1-phosphate guanylyltransferase/mannose-6-phosphate isomerase [Alphaproteobacteria bacterium]|nr:mannose-1-phosphate guanylyltransferase/mannose-6-phosphate isomerase [Alphaproteobacteria bacterium]